MRLRTVSAAAVCALTMLLATPSPATAATGDFLYQYRDSNGALQMGHLTDPPSGQCVTLPEVEAESVPPAHSPRNFTNSTAAVFTDVECEGDYFSLRPNGGHGSERLKLRSVVFS